MAVTLVSKLLIWLVLLSVTLFEYSSELKADNVLQDRLRSLENVDIKTNARTTGVIGEDHQAY